MFWLGWELGVAFGIGAGFGISAFLVHPVRAIALAVPYHTAQLLCLILH
jgi:hypothetical protein